jgi:hypothetical protein
MFKTRDVEKSVKKTVNGQKSERKRPEQIRAIV